MFKDDLVGIEHPNHTDQFARIRPKKIIEPSLMIVYRTLSEEWSFHKNEIFHAHNCVGSVDLDWMGLSFDSNRRLCASETQHRVDPGG